MPAIDAQAVSQPWRRHPPGLPPSRHTLNAASRKDCHLRAGHLRAPPSARPRSGGRPVTWRARMTVRRVRHLPAVSLSCLAVLSRQARAERAGRTGRTCRPRQPRASPCTLASRVRWPAGYSGQPGGRCRRQRRVVVSWLNAPLAFSTELPIIIQRACDTRRNNRRAVLKHGTIRRASERLAM